MRKLTQKLKDATIGAFIPGSIGHQCAKWLVNDDIAWDIRNEGRTNLNYTISERLYYGALTGFLGLYELGVHSIIYGNVVNEILNLNSEFLKVYNGEVNLKAALAATAMGAAIRAGLYLFYKAGRNESEESIQEALNERTQVATA